MLGTRVTAMQCDDSANHAEADSHPLEGLASSPCDCVNGAKTRGACLFGDRLPLKYARARTNFDPLSIAERDDLLDILEHPNPDRYAGQRILVVQREDTYTWCRSSRTSTRHS